MAFRGFTRSFDFRPAGVEGRQVAGMLATFAQERLAEAIAEGVATPRHLRVVNGRVGAEEASVEVPGPIVYRMDWVEAAARFAMPILVAGAPAKSGRYRRSFFVMVNGARGDLNAVPIGAEIVISNDQPYTRKVHVGAKGFELHKGLFEKVRQQVLTEFPGVIKAHVMFLDLAGGYVLKGGAPRRLASASRRSSVTRAGGTHLSQRKATRAGQKLTYPSLVLWSPLTPPGGYV